MDPQLLRKAIVGQLGELVLSNLEMAAQIKAQGEQIAKLGEEVDKLKAAQTEKSDAA